MTQNEPTTEEILDALITRARDTAQQINAGSPDEFMWAGIESGLALATMIDDERKTFRPKTL